MITPPPEDPAKLLADLRYALENLPPATWRLHPPLPRRVRARLAISRIITNIGIRLIDAGHIEAATRLWRACHML